MQTRSRQTGTLTHHGNGLHIPPGRNEAVHLSLHLNREPVAQSIPHSRIEPHESHPGATWERRQTAACVPRAESPQAALCTTTVYEPTRAFWLPALTWFLTHLDGGGRPPNPVLPSARQFS